MSIRKVLAFGLPVIKNMAVISVCQKTGAEFRLIKPQEVHKSLGTLSGVVGMEKKAPEYDSEENPGEFLFFAGFDGEKLDDFLAEYKKIGVGSVLFKAMITEYNVLWSPAFLYKELEKERLKMKLNR